MPDNVDITIHFLPRDADYFEELCETTVSSEQFPGLMTGNVVGPPHWLDDYTEREYFGMHGSFAGQHGAYQLICRGGELFYHPCDENGHFSLYASDPYDLDGSPLVIPVALMEYAIILRKLIREMLDIAAEDIKKRMAEIEEEEKKKREEEFPAEDEEPESSK